MATRKRKKATPWTQTKRKAKRALDRHPGLSLAAMILFGLLAIVCLMIGLIAENLLYFLAMGLSSLGAVAAARTKHLAEQRQAQSTRTAKKPRAPRPSATAPPPEQKPSGPVTCTKTGKQVHPEPEREEDRCPCPQRHVISEKGVRRYGLPLGSPITVRTKEPRVPTTSRAKPTPPGYAMRKDS